RVDRSGIETARCARGETRLAQVQGLRTSSRFNAAPAKDRTRSHIPRWAGPGEARRSEHASRPRVAAAPDLQEHARVVRGAVRAARHPAQHKTVSKLRISPSSEYTFAKVPPHLEGPCAMDRVVHRCCVARCALL